MGKALYRKYRSKSLDEIVGQRHITDGLKNAIKKQRFAHAYLLTGPRGVGKTSVARILAHEINKLPYTDESTHLDIIEIDAASNRRIDDIRELREKVHIAPTSAQYKVYIIDEVHMLTAESFNALLKTLEEPPEHVIFILATTELHKLPATIISRTQRYNFRLIEPTELKQHLAGIAKNEGIAVDDAALDLIAEHGEGSFRDSISLLDQLAGSGKKLTASVVEDILGLASTKHVAALVDAITTQDARKAHDTLYEFEKAGVPPASVVKQLIAALKAKAETMPSLYSLIDQLIDVPKSDNARLKLLTVVLMSIDGTRTTAEGKSDAPKTAKPSSAATHTSSKEPILTISKALPKKSAKSTQTADTSSETITLSDDTWREVLADIKVANPPLYGVLKHGQQSLEQDGRTLVITFGFGLHAKKIDDPKYRSILSASLLKACGGTPEIVIKVDKSMAKSAPESLNYEVPAHISEAPDSQTASVLAMMGGGDVVNGSEQA